MEKCSCKLAVARLVWGREECSSENEAIGVGLLPLLTQRRGPGLRHWLNPITMREIINLQVGQCGNQIGTKV